VICYAECRLSGQVSFFGFSSDVVDEWMEAMTDIVQDPMEFADEVWHQD
jgi:hypothetical protein